MILERKKGSVGYDSIPPLPIPEKATMNSIPKRLLMLVLASVLVPSAATAQSGVTKINKTLQTRDGWPIKISYYPSKAGKESPVVVLLHGDNENRAFWEIKGKSWAEALQAQGIAAITVDLRKHGESKPPGVDEVKLSGRDYQAMVSGDMEAVKDFIFDEHQDEKLNMRKMGIVGSEFSTAVALNYAWKDWTKKPWPDAPTLAARTPRGQDVRALVLISPSDRVSGLSNGRAIAFLRNPAVDLGVLVIYGDKDPADDGTAHDLFEKFEDAEQENRERVFEVKFPVKRRGISLIIDNAAAQTAFLNFTNKLLSERPEDWVNRKSPIDTSID